MGNKAERRGLYPVSQKVINSSRNGGPDFDDMDKAVKAVCREKRIKKSLEEFKEIEELAEAQRISYENRPREHIEDSGNVGLNVEPVKGGLPSETIEQLQEVKEGSQKDSSVKEPSLLPRGLRFSPRDLKNQG